MNAVQDDPLPPELEKALILWLIATGDLSAFLARNHGALPPGRRIALDVLDTRLSQARAAAEDAFAVAPYSPR
jgi:hypothetical protein